jgi:predicted lipid-binding transport protein (Tim44 family)
MRLRLMAVAIVASLLGGACASPPVQTPTMTITTPSAPSARPSSAGTSSPGPAQSAIASTATPSPSSEAFRVNADEAAAISTVERFIQSINAGDVNGAATLVAQDAGVSDCDYIHRTVALFNGKPSVMQWLAARIAEHDQFAIGSIFNENDVFTPVVGVEFANRSNDTLTRLGSPSGVVPAEVAKVVLTPDMTQIRGFLFGPGGADPRTIAEVCGPT